MTDYVRHYTTRVPEGSRFAIGIQVDQDGVIRFASSGWYYSFPILAISLVATVFSLIIMFESSAIAFGNVAFTCASFLFVVYAVDVALWKESVVIDVSLKSVEYTKRRLFRGSKINLDVSKIKLAECDLWNIRIGRNSPVGVAISVGDGIDPIVLLSSNAKADVQKYISSLPEIMSEYLCDEIWCVRVDRLPFV